MRAFLSAILVLAFAGFTTAQDKKDEKMDFKKLLGKWEFPETSKNAKVVIEFAEMGKMAMQISIDGKTQTKEGTYKIDGNKIEISHPDILDETSRLVVSKLTDDELVYTDPTKVTLKRVKPKK